MESAVTIARARELFASLPRPLGFVPTMGALHAGHLELVRRARLACAGVAASIFVNPMQFAPNEDLARYPRDPGGDAAKLEAAGVDALFAPDATAMYGGDFACFVEPGPIGSAFEGAYRPTHFRGVATVIAKLLNIARPDVLFLGQKDAQQAVLVRKMIGDLNFGVDVEVVPTVRESDGVAMSSRNRYLDAAQRAAAPTLYRALRSVRDALERGAEKREAIDEAAEPLRAVAEIDYIDVVDARDFAPLERLRPPAFVIGAARFGTTRLIDNLWIER
ncbi:MAG TPA: pantoate--beta-alanine ligase [Candidatus Binatia bacterium]|nr:pantoate--beta-alanine ligase [Candidatus Binatia bacterium]